ncbi:MAG: glycosyltransferase family 39 protein [Magnetococcales bacterium]|nr:glycosyltransferase family 39 protein [Magnetococcales bacterium]
MAAIASIPVNALLVLLLALTGTVLRATHGHLHPIHLPLLTFALFGIGAFFVLFGERVTPLRSIERWLSGVWFLFAFFLLLDDETIYSLDNTAHRLVQIGLWINAALALYLWAGMTFADRDDPHWRRILLGGWLLWPVILVAVLSASPNPNIDVFHHGIEAVEHLFAGKNPYAEPLSDLYQGAYGYIPGYIYLPVILVANALAHAFLGDIRHTYTIAQLVILLVLWRMGRNRGFSPVACHLLAMVWISFPVTLFVIEQAWNDTLLIAFSALLAWSLDRQIRGEAPRAWWTTAIFLGLAVATKQYAVVLAWITLLFLWRRFGLSLALRVAGVSLSVFLVTVLPFFLWDPASFIAHPILEVAGYRIRGDALSWIAYLLSFSGMEIGGGIILTIYFLIAGAVTLWLIVHDRLTLFHWALAAILIFGGLFLFGKQAFCNYYHFLAFFILLALLFAQEKRHGTSESLPDSTRIPGQPGHLGPETMGFSFPAFSTFGSAPILPQPLFWTLMTVAVLIRLTFLDMIEFKEDEFNAIVLAWKQFSEGVLAQTGLKSSTGLFNPPFFIYLMSLPVAVTTDPILVTLFVIMFNLVGLVLLYDVLRWAFSANVAALTTLLFASSPWVVLYSRKIWAQDFLFPFMMGLVALLVSMSERSRPWKTWLLFFLLAVVTQLHMSAWFLPPAILLFMVRFRVAVRWRDLGVGLAVLSLLYVPYLRFHVQTGFQNLIEAINLMGGQDNPFPAGNLLWMVLIATGVGFSYLLGNDGFSRFWEANLIALPYGMFFLFFMLTVLGWVWVMGHHWPFRTGNRVLETPRGARMVTLLFWIMVTIQGAYVLLSIPSFPHYAIIFFPSLFLFAVLLLGRFHEWLAPGRRRGVVVGLVTAIVVANLYHTISFHSFVLYNPQSISGDYGVPYFVDRQRWKHLLPGP